MENSAVIELELRKLGLNAKEAKVYLASLELGPTSAQSIAKATGLTRPTTYEIIKKLENKELFAQTKGNKKRFFAAQSPEKILGLLKTQRRELDEKEREFIRIISTLESRYSKDKEKIKLFIGAEGIKSLEEIISFSSVSEIMIINPKDLPISKERIVKIYQEIKKRLGKLDVSEINARIEGSLIIFDKVSFFPKGKNEGFLMS
jgi:sugar-specific transcriptional regulator TrmB